MQVDMHSERLTILHDLYTQKWVDAVLSGNYELAIFIEFEHYNTIVKPIESRYFWDLWQEFTLPFKNELTTEFTRVIPNAKVNRNKNSFLIVLGNYSGLAHEQQLARNINFLRQSGYNLVFDVVYLFDYTAMHHEMASQLYNIPKSSIIFLKSKSYIEAGKFINIISAHKRYSTILYPSIIQTAFWMSLFVAHPNQKFLQMKYFPRQSGRFSSWAGGRKNMEDYINVNGDKYLQLSILNPHQLNAQSNTLQPFSQTISNDFIRFGSISRPEKVSDADYNKTVFEILEEFSNSIYLLTGNNSSLNVIPDFITSHGRTSNLGWVDPIKSINLFDIYLESFPWGGGDMSLLALESMKPYLTLETEENKIVGIYDFLTLIAENSDKITEFSFCHSIEELKRKYKDLHIYPDLRETLGQAWKQALQNYQPIDANKWYSFLVN